MCFWNQFLNKFPYKAERGDKKMKSSEVIMASYADNRALCFPDTRERTFFLEWSYFWRCKLLRLWCARFVHLASDGARERGKCEEKRWRMWWKRWGKKGCAQGSFGPSYIHSFLDLSSFLPVPDAHGDEHDSWLNEMEPKALSTFGQIKNKMYWTRPYSKSWSRSNLICETLYISRGPWNGHLDRGVKISKVIL